MLDGRELDGLLGYHLRFANSVVTRDFLQQMRVLGLSQKTFATLTLIRSNPGVSQVELARHLRMDKATMTTVVDRLRSDGLVELRDAADDKRRRPMFLTDDGEAVWKTGKKRAIDHEKKFRDLFTSEERAILVAALKRISRY